MAVPALMTEAELLARVDQLARGLGVLVYHTHDSRRSEPGFPDLTLVGCSIVFRELKSDSGRLSRAQQMWGRRIVAAGGSWAVWRPVDLLDGTITRTLEALR